MHQTKSATRFLDLSDDILGTVYGMVEDSASRTALRHSCTTLYRLVLEHPEGQLCKGPGTVFKLSFLLCLIHAGEFPRGGFCISLGHWLASTFRCQAAAVLAKA